jgi:hypothetical protein
MEIRMKTTCDCMVAALAMLLNCSYDEASQYFPLKAIQETGYRWEWLVPYLKRCGINLIWYSGELLSYVDWTKPAIVDVPSLTTDKGDHIIFWNGVQVVDPSNTIKYEKLPKEIINVYQLKCGSANVL